MGTQCIITPFLCACLAIGALASPASSMTADEFVTRGNALKAKGMMAVFQKKEINALGAEIREAATAYRTDLGKLPSGDMSLGCPPPQGKAGITSRIILERFNAFPRDARQQMTVKTAYYTMMKQSFPCGSAQQGAK
jgi:hypothetical protein